MGGAVACFLTQLTAGAVQGVFSRIELASRKLQHHLLHRVAVLPLHQQLTVIEQRNDHHRAGVDDVLTGGRATRWQAHRVSERVQKMPFEQLLAVDAVFDQVRIRHRSPLL